MIINDLFIRVHRVQTSSVLTSTQDVHTVCHTYSYLTALLCFSGRVDVRFFVQNKVYAGFVAAAYQLKLPTATSRVVSTFFETLAQSSLTRTRLTVASFHQSRRNGYSSVIHVLCRWCYSAGNRFHVTYLVALRFTLPILR